MYELIVKDGSFGPGMIPTSTMFCTLYLSPLGKFSTTK